MIQSVAQDWFFIRRHWEPTKGRKQFIACIWIYLRKIYKHQKVRIDNFASRRRHHSSRSSAEGSPPPAAFLPVYARPWVCSCSFLLWSWTPPTPISKSFLSSCPFAPKCSPYVRPPRCTARNITQCILFKWKPLNWNIVFRKICICI